MQGPRDCRSVDGVLPKVDSGHLYKFLVTSGLALMAAAVALPWLLLREQSVLLIDEAEISRLTGDAQRAVRHKQHQFLWLIEHYHWMSIVAVVGGAAMVALGFTQWWKRQRIQDRKEDSELREQTLRVDAMTPAEQAERREGEVETLTEDAVAAADAGSTRSTTATERDDVRKEYRQLLSSAEALVTERLAEVFAPDYTLRRNVAVEISPLVKIPVDAVLQPLSKSSTARVWFVEVKAVSSPNNALTRVRGALSEVAPILLRGVSEPKPGALLVIVVLDSAMGTEPTRLRTERVASEIRRWGDLPMAVLVTTERALRETPSHELRSYVRPGTVTLLRGDGADVNYV